jgi:hypothetical protein
MEVLEALEIVRRLAAGQHPETGQSLPQDSVYRNPQAVGALQEALDALEFRRHRRKTANTMPSNSGKAWTEPEDSLLRDELRRGMGLAHIASLHNRRVGSIVARIMLLRSNAALDQRPRPS